MKNAKSFMCGMLTMALIIGLVGTAAAAVTKQLTANYNSIKISLNGVETTPKDANGNTVEPFIVNGTTYLPVRAVAGMLGLYVSWDGSTNTVILSSADATQSGKVIMDKNGVKVTYLGITQKESPLKGYDINLKIENTSGTNYTVQARDLSLNGVMSKHIIFSSDVVAGKTANDAIWVYGLDEDGISTPITTAEFKLTVFNSKTYDGNFDSDVITISN